MWPPTWNQPWTGLLCGRRVAEGSRATRKLPGPPRELQRDRTHSESPLAAECHNDTAPAPGRAVVCHSCVVSAGRLVLVLGGIALVAVVAIGVRQAAEKSSAPPKTTTLSAGET